MSGNEEQDWQQYWYIQNKILAESVDGSKGYHNQQFTSACKGCPNYVLDEWDVFPLVKGIDLGLYPSPCNCDCCYCNIHTTDGMEWKTETNDIKDGYDKAIRFLEYGEKIGFIHPDAKWMLTSGEISVHPYRDRIFELVKGRKTDFVTNCLVYNKTIGDHLREQSESRIYTSIDCGTARYLEKG